MLHPEVQGRNRAVRWAATSSIALAAVLILIPWQICDCAGDGPHLELLWAHTECASTQAPDSGDADSEPDCDTLFTFDACVAAGAPALSSPDDARHVDLALLTSCFARPSRTLDGPRTTTEPPDLGGLAPHAALVTRLLI